MEKGYHTFVRKFQDELLAAAGLEETEIYFKQKDECPDISDDRLFLVRETKEDTKEVCALHTRELYEQYLSGTSLQSLTELVLLEVQKVKGMGLVEKIQDISDYEKIKSSLFIRLLNVNLHREKLRNAVYYVLGDIALALYVKIGESEGLISSTKVQEDVLHMWPCEREEVFKEALMNTYYMAPPRIYSWEKLFFHPGYRGEAFMNLLEEHQLHKDCMGNCLSTLRKTEGAVAIFLPGVAERLADLLGANFYIVFTSVHEVMIHNETQVDPEDLRTVLKDTIKEATSEEEFLSYYIYHYNRKTRQFSYL